VDVPIDTRQLRYFVAVAEELHFGRAADRLHMSQSPLSRAIRELERELGVVLFVRTTRHVELTAAGSALLEHARRALVELDAAVDDARLAAGPAHGELALGYGPFSGSVATWITQETAAQHPDREVRLDEDVTPDLLQRVAGRELTAAVVMETPVAARRYRVRIDSLKDEPLLAALPTSHAHANAPSIPVAAFAEECLLLPREPVGRMFNEWLRAVIRAAGSELERTRETLSAPWDRRMLPVAEGAVVSVFVGEWVDEAIAGVAAVPFDPPLSFPIDLATPFPSTDDAELLLTSAKSLRDTEGWLTQRPVRTELPGD
jgi:DNA-binding transcriptional LysR family regulator